MTPDVFFSHITHRGRVFHLNPELVDSANLGSPCALWSRKLLEHSWPTLIHQALPRLSPSPLHLELTEGLSACHACFPQIGAEGTLSSSPWLPVGRCSYSDGTQSGKPHIEKGQECHQCSLWRPTALPKTGTGDAHRCLASTTTGGCVQKLP